MLATSTERTVMGKVTDPVAAMTEFLLVGHPNACTAFSTPAFHEGYGGNSERMRQYKPKDGKTL